MSRPAGAVQWRGPHHRTDHRHAYPARLADATARDDDLGVIVSEDVGDGTQAPASNGDAATGEVAHPLEEDPVAVGVDLHLVLRARVGGVRIDPEVVIRVEGHLGVVRGDPESPWTVADPDPGDVPAH